MKIKLLLTAVVCAAFAGMTSGAPVPENVPELMKTFGGEKVESLEQWEKVRAPEIVERFRHEVFGVRPKEAEDRSRVSFEVTDTRDAMDGKAMRKMVTVKFAAPKGEFSFPVTVFIPKGERPVPAFVFICNRPRSNIDPDRSIKSEFWPAEEIVARGYATAAFQFCDVAMDDRNAGFGRDVFAAFQDVNERTGDSWAAISAWAWGASRILDWMETEPLIDAKHVGVVGHSRGGKTAIWAGATDKRFAMVCSNNSGCTGARINHINLPKAETIDKICRFTHWFCKNYDKYRGKDKTMDFDQHELLAVIAPRLLCVASATADNWAGQPGEWWGAKLASPAWELYGKRGLVADAWPKAETPQQDGFVSYHMRTGKHDLTPYDWGRYMDFADRHGWRPQTTGADSLTIVPAPRALLIEGFGFSWFDPEGEFLSVKAASPVWEFLTGKGIDLDKRPKPYDVVGLHPPLGYVCRTEEHGLSPYDWKWALDFADGCEQMKNACR